MVYILLGAGFEEAEALVTADVLRRGGVAVVLAGIGTAVVEGAHGIRVVCDLPAEDVGLNAGDTVLLPGGMGGVAAIEASEAAMALVRRAAEDSAMYLAAICAAPTLLARRGIIGSGNRAVCYPGMEEMLLHGGVAACMDEAAVRDGHLITGKGPGTAYEFALLVLEALTDAETAARVRAELHFRT